MNTVELNGKYFEQHVEVGSRVSKGTKIVSFDKKAIEKEGYDMTIPVVVTNSTEFKIIQTVDSGKVDQDTDVIYVA